MRKLLRGRNLRGVASLIGAAAMVGAMSGGLSGASTRAMASERFHGPPITIAGTLGLTGAFSVPSADYKLVDEAWVNTVNAHGGLLGRKVELTILNDNSTPTTASTDYQKFISEKVNFILAPYTTYVGGPQVPVVRAAGKLFYNGGFVGLQYFEQDKGWMVGSYTYQDTTYSHGAFTVMKSLPPSKRPKKIAILYAANPFTVAANKGYNGTGGALTFAKRDGMKVVMDEQYPTGTTDFTSTIEKAQAAGAQALIVLGLPTTSDLIAKTVKTIGWKPEVECMCGSQVTTLDNWYTLGAATNGVIGTDVAWESENYPGMKQVEALARKKHEKVVPSYSWAGWAILQMIQQGVDGTHSTTTTKIRKWLLTHVVSTAVGKFKLLGNGSPPNREVVVQTVNGVQRTVWPPKIATAKIVTPLP
jgi:branched-chain amino acid transport system substrate-binding protein